MPPFVRRMGIDYVVLLGDSHVSSLYGGLEVLPTTYYISPHGDVIAFVNGVLSKTEVERDIRETACVRCSELGLAHSAYCSLARTEIGFEECCKPGCYGSAGSAFLIW